MRSVLTIVCVALTGWQSSMRRALHADDIERVEYILAKDPTIVEAELPCDFDDEIEKCRPVFFVHSAEMMTLLLENGANPNDLVLNVFGRKQDVLSWYTPNNFDHRIPEVLLRFGALPNGSSSSDSGPPLRFAAANKSVDIAKMLLDYVADSNLQNTYDGSTALHGAAWNGGLAMVELLISAGANPEIRDHSGQTAYDTLTSRRLPYSQSEFQKMKDLLRPNCEGH